MSFLGASATGQDLRLREGDPVTAFSQLDFGDVDGDGDLDLITFGFEIDLIEYEEEAFLDPVTLTSSFTGSYEAALGDMDMDGDLDVAAVSRFTGEVLIYSNDGTGSFGQGFVVSAGYDFRTIEVFDRDGDGDNDLLVGHSEGILQLENLGALQFQQSDLPAPMESVSNMVAGDLDSDGDVDLVAQGRVYLNLGASLWGQPQPGPIGSDLSTLIDIDGDGDLDFLQGTQAKWYPGDGAGGFGAYQQYSDQNFRYATAADFDRDGDVDVLAEGDGGLFLFVQQSAGQFGEPGVVANVSEANFQVAKTRDMNQDGWPDLLHYVSATGSRTVRLQINEGRGAEWGAVRLAQPAIKQLNVIATGDLEGDGVQELFWFRNFAGSDYEVAWAAFEGGVLQPSTRVGQFSGASSTPRSLGTADMDSDGDLDALVAMRTRLVWLENVDPAGPWLEHPVGSPVDNIREALAADMDGDGDQDLLFARKENSSLWYFENQGQGQFGAPTVFASLALKNCAMTPADLDGDGDLDLVTAGCGALAPVAWIENMGLGTFAPAALLPVVIPVPSDLQSVDWDADGDEDLVYLADNGMALQALENLGGGMLGQPVSLVEFSLAVSDLLIHDSDHDGRPDAFCVQRDQRAVERFPNLTVPGGLFEVGPGQRIAGGLEFPRTIAKGDVDGDGDEDLMVAGYLKSSSPFIQTYETLSLIPNRACSATALCFAAPNSTGVAASLESVGSLRLSDDDVRLEASGLAPGSFALLTFGRGLDFRPVGGTSPGFLCGGGLIRVPATITSATATGVASLSLPLQGLPQGLAFQPGESWIAQVAYRDLDPGPLFNTTNGLEITWCCE